MNIMIIYLTEKEVKDELLKMLVYFDKFCVFNNIKYSIMSGTMLGAIRHLGFIPWDDDIDVGLLRPDYEKLIYAIKLQDSLATHDEKYCFIGNEINGSDKPYIKMLNKEIKVEGNDTEDKYLWIDIFPFDGMPRYGKKLYQVYYNKYLSRARDFKINNFYKTIQNQQKNIIKKFYCYIVNEKFKDKNLFEVNSLIINQSKKFDATDSKYIQDIVWGKKYIPQYLFDEVADYQFEGITVKGFKDYDTYLKAIYGDYMKLPPEEQRVNHGIKAWRVTDDQK